MRDCAFKLVFSTKGDMSGAQRHAFLGSSSTHTGERKLRRLRGDNQWCSQGVGGASVSACKFRRMAAFSGERLGTPWGGRREESNTLHVGRTGDTVRVIGL